MFVLQLFELAPSDLDQVKGTVLDSGLAGRTKNLVISKTILAELQREYNLRQEGRVPRADLSVCFRPAPRPPVILAHLQGSVVRGQLSALVAQADQLRPQSQVLFAEVVHTAAQLLTLSLQKQESEMASCSSPGHACYGSR